MSNNNIINTSINSNKNNYNLTTEDLIPSEQKLNKIRRRLIILSPTVELGFERECCNKDFYRENENPIGTGAFGKVWLVKHYNTHKIYCIKIISKRNIIEQKLINQLNQEISIMYQINHPNSIKLYNHFEENERIYLIMEYAPNSSIFFYLKKNSNINISQKLQFFRDTCSIIKYLHSKHIVHRDIKPENLLLDKNYRIKLCDYGWATYLQPGEKIKTFCGTFEYAAPEILKKIEYDEKVDIWSLGILLFELLTGYTPFKGKTNDEKYYNICKGLINWPKDINKEAKNLISKILKLNPKDRLNIDDILKHKLFNDFPAIYDELKIEKLTKKDIMLSLMMNNDDYNNNSKDKLNSSNKSLNSTEEETLISNEYNNSLEKEQNDYLKNENKRLKITILNLDKENIELKNKLNDFECLKKNNENLLKENENLNKKIEDLNNKLNEREIIIYEYEKINKENLELKNKLIDFNKLFEENKNLNNLKINYEKNILDLKQKINFNNLNNNINNIKQNDDDNYKIYENINNKLNQIITIKNENEIILNNKINDIQNLFLNEFEISLNKILNNYKNQQNCLENILLFKSKKYFEKIDFLINELNKYKEYKQKYLENNEKIIVLDKNLKIFVEKYRLILEQNTLLEKNSKIKEEIFNDMKKKIQNYEAKILDFKVFINKNCSKTIINTYNEIFN